MTNICDVRAWIVNRTDFFQQAASGRASIITDPKGLKPKLFRIETRRGEYTLSGDTPGTGQPQGKGRTEALVGNPHVGSSSQNFGYDPQEGSDYYHWWQFEFPGTGDEPTADPVLAGRSTGDNMIMSQSNSYDSTGHGSGLTAVWQQQAAAQALVFGNGAWSLPKAQFQIGKRYEVLWHAHFSSNSSVGYDEVWVLNDARDAWVYQSKKFTQNLKASANGTFGIYHKFGQYHHFSTTGGPWVMYHSGVKVGTARADVDPLTSVTQVPDPPVLTGGAGDTVDALAWTTPARAESYKLFRDGVQVGPASITATSYTDTGLTNLVTYHYTVKAHNSIGDSAASNSLALTPQGGTIKPPGNLQDLVDLFDGTTADGTIWTSLTGTQSQSNGQLSLQATSASIASRKSDANYSAEGATWPFRLSQAAAYASGPATTVETRIMLTARDAGPALGDFVVAKVVKTNVDTVGQMSVIFVFNDVQDNPQTSVAVPFTYDPVAMLYGRFVINQAGTSVAFQTSPDGTTWTTRRAATTPSWTLANVRAKVELTARITSGTGAVTPAIFDEVGATTTPPPPPPTTAIVPIPGGLQANDLIVMTAGIGNQAANLQNSATLPFRWFGTLEGGAYGDGIANVTARAWAGVKVYNPLTDTASWPLQFDASTEYAIEALVIRGAQAQAADQGISGVLTSSPAAGTSFTVDCGSSPVAGARVYILAVADTDATAGDWAAGAGGLTRVAVGKRTPEGASIAIYAQTISAAGTAVSRTVSHAATVAPVFITWFVRPGQSG